MMFWRDRVDRWTFGRRKKLSPFTVAGIIVLCVILCSTVFYKTQGLKQQSVAYAKQIATLEQEKKNLQKQRKAVKELKKQIHSDEYTEQIAREKLGLVYKDEVVFMPRGH